MSRGELSSTAIQAKEIRARLKVEFPNIKFSVRTDNYSMGSSIRIKWDNAPITAQVRTIAAEFESVSRDEYTGEILSGGNTYVFADREITDEYRAQVEQYIIGEFTRYNWEYNRQWSRAEERMIETQQVQMVAPVEVATVEAIAPQPVTVTLNEEKRGIEIRFESKPSDGILSMLKENGFRWGRGFWWAKQSPERLTLANAIVDMLATPAQSATPATVQMVADAPAEVVESDAPGEVETIDRYATPEYAANCHMKAWDMEEDQLSNTFDTLHIPHDIAGGKFIFRNLTREQYAHVVRINETNGAIIFDDGGEYVSVQSAQIIDFTSRRVKSWMDNLTPEQHLKLHLITEIIGADEVGASVAKGMSVDQLFTIAAEVYMQNKKQM